MSDKLVGLSGSEKRALLARLLEEKAQLESAQNPKRCFPQSAGQQGLWFSFCHNPKSTAYNVFFSVAVSRTDRLECLETVGRGLSRSTRFVAYRLR